MSITTDKWTVEIFLGEQDGTTHAHARLHTHRASPVTATGSASLSSEDRVDVGEIGYELAAARALRALADELLHTAELDVDALVELAADFGT